MVRIISLLLSHYIMMLKQTIHAGFMYTNLFPTNCTIHSFDAATCVSHEQQVSSGSDALHLSPSALGHNMCTSKLCIVHISLQAFAVTEFNKMFLSRQPCQGVRVLQCFRDWFHPLLEGPTDGLEEPNSFGFTKPSAMHPEDRDGVSPWNFR
jgi:hypothetical protein